MKASGEVPQRKPLAGSPGNLGAQPSSATNCPWCLGDTSEPPTYWLCPPVIQMVVGHHVGLESNWWWQWQQDHKSSKARLGPVLTVSNANQWQVSTLPAKYLG